jgi:hypothetical protein
LASKNLKLFVVGLKLSVILKIVLFFMSFFARVKDNYPACIIPNGKHIASVVEFNDTYDVFFLNFFR